MAVSKQFIVFIGNYGSGKTELSLNFALHGARAREKTVLVDLDIVNPYFRSSEQSNLLENSGVTLIAPPYAKTGVDLPVLSAVVDSVFVRDYDRVVFDVGGDSVGAAALGRYLPQFDAVRAQVNAYYVVNIRRPLSRNATEIMRLLDHIVVRSRMPITGIINNANLARDTSAEDLILGDAIVREVSDKTGIPVRFAAGWPNVLAEFERLLPDHAGESLPIETFMRPGWLDSTR